MDVYVVNMQGRGRYQGEERGQAEKVFQEHSELFKGSGGEGPIQIEEFTDRPRGYTQTFAERVGYCDTGFPNWRPVILFGP